MSVTVRAVLALQPGCRLLYDCPSMGDDWEATKFFDTYRGKYATFVGYDEGLVGPLDYLGRKPGRYINPKGIHVIFDGEERVHKGVNTSHFVVIETNSTHVQVVEPAKEPHYVGELLHPVLFYPDDIVRFLKKPLDSISDDPREVRNVFLEKPFVEDDDVPRYEVMETHSEAAERSRKFDEENEARPEGHRFLMNMARGIPSGWNVSATELVLVTRGNVWALYNDPAQVSFDSVETELAFWARGGVSHHVSLSDTERQQMTIADAFGHSLEEAWNFFTSEKADIIGVCEISAKPKSPPSYTVSKLHKCWAQHRERVRALTMTVWAHQLKDSVA